MVVPLHPRTPSMTDTAPQTGPTGDSLIAHTITGDVRTHDNFHSRYLEQDRTVIV